MEKINYDQIQGDVCVPWSSKSLTHRYSLPILRQETNFEGNPTFQENIIWDNSMYKDETKSQKKRPMYKAPRELDYEKKSEIMNKEANPMYKDDIKSRSTQYSNICLDQVSDAELDSRLAHLCLSVTKNALEQIYLVMYVYVAVAIRNIPFFHDPCEKSSFSILKTNNINTNKCS